MQEGTSRGGRTPRGEDRADFADATGPRLRLDQRDSERPGSSLMNDAGWPSPPRQDQRGAERTDWSLADNADLPLPSRPGLGRHGAAPCPGGTCVPSTGGPASGGSSSSSPRPFLFGGGGRGEVSPAPLPCPGARGASLDAPRRGANPCRRAARGITLHSGTARNTRSAAYP